MTEVQRNKRQLTCRELLTQIMVRHNNRLPGGARTMSPDRTTSHRGSRALWHWIAALAFVAAGAFAAAATAQVETEAPPVVEGAGHAVIERIEVHSPAIEGNLEGNPADRDVLVVLPPSYRANPGRRYPVVYALHGYSIGAEQWIQEIRVPQVVEGAFAKDVPEMIVVLPDSKTVHNGSMYSSSVTTGDFEDFVAHDLVGYIDSHYRTIPDRKSRGLVGHSMGGYGAALAVGD